MRAICCPKCGREIDQTSAVCVCGMSRKRICQLLDNSVKNVPAAGRYHGPNSLARHHTLTNITDAQVSLKVSKPPLPVAVKRQGIQPGQVIGGCNKQELNLNEAMARVERDVEAEFHVKVKHDKCLYMEDVKAALTKSGSKKGAYISTLSERGRRTKKVPDGGTSSIVSAKTGEECIILSSEAKSQGAHGNAGERTSAMTDVFRDRMACETILPFTVFLQGDIVDHSEKMAQYRNACEYVLPNTERPDDPNPQISLWACKNGHTVDEMVEVLKPKAFAAVKYYINKYGRAFFTKV